MPPRGEVRRYRRAIMIIKVQQGNAGERRCRGRAGGGAAPAAVAEVEPAAAPLMNGLWSILALQCPRGGRQKRAHVPATHPVVPVWERSLQAAILRAWMHCKRNAA